MLNQYREIRGLNMKTLKQLWEENEQQAIKKNINELVIEWLKQKCQYVSINPKISRLTINTLLEDLEK